MTDEQKQMLAEDELQIRLLIREEKYEVAILAIIDAFTKQVDDDVAVPISMEAVFYVLNKFLEEEGRQLWSEEDFMISVNLMQSRDWVKVD